MTLPADIAERLARLALPSQAVIDGAREIIGAAYGAFFYNVVGADGESYALYRLSGAPPEAFANFPMPRKTEVFAPTFDGVGVVRSDDITQDPRHGRNAPWRGMPSIRRSISRCTAVM